MTARLAVVGGPGNDFDALIATAIERAGERPVDLTVIAIARRPIAWAFAPLTGRVSPEQLSRDAYEAAADAARRALRRLGRDVSARYVAVERWPQLRRSLGGGLADLHAVVIDDDVQPHLWNRWRRDPSCASSLGWPMAGS